MALNIVLIEPEIPNNTGNIGRLALATGSKLHLVKPFGFEISDSRLKRAGLDYWKHLDITYYESSEDFFRIHKDQNFAFFSSHGSKPYWNVPFQDELFLIFGKESVGLPKSLIGKYQESVYTIPMFSVHVRSINLANAVSIIAFEGMRQLNSK